jgi:hypothetical protein
VELNNEVILNSRFANQLISQDETSGGRIDHEYLDNFSAFCVIDPCAKTEYSTIYKESV